RASTCARRMGSPSWPTTPGRDQSTMEELSVRATQYRQVWLRALRRVTLRIESNEASPPAINRSTLSLLECGISPLAAPSPTLTNGSAHCLVVINSRPSTRRSPDRHWPSLRHLARRTRLRAPAFQISTQTSQLMGVLESTASGVRALPRRPRMPLATLQRGADPPLRQLAHSSRHLLSPLRLSRLVSRSPTRPELRRITSTVPATTTLT